MNEKFCLKWNDFQQNINYSFKDLRECQDFSDVTLVCEENLQIEGHRVILSACSPIFQNILKNNKQSHPLIYMRGVKTKCLSGIVDFIYHGEANIYQDDLDDFLALAEELQLKGLSGGNNLEDWTQKSASENIKETKPAITKQNPHGTVDKEEMNILYEIEKDENLTISEISYDERTVFVPKPIKSVVSLDTANELDEQIYSMMLKVEGKWSCTACGKIANQKSNMTQHIEANHIEGVTHTCNHCGKTSRSKNALNVHVSRFHNSK